MRYVTRIDLLQEATWIRLFRQQEETEENDDGDRNSSSSDDYDTSSDALALWRRSSNYERRRVYSSYRRRVVRCWTESCLNRWSSADFTRADRRNTSGGPSKSVILRQQVDRTSASELSTANLLDAVDERPRYSSVLRLRRRQPIIVTEPPQCNLRPEFLPPIAAVNAASPSTSRRRRSRRRRRCGGCCARLFFRSTAWRRNDANISANSRKRPSTAYSRGRKSGAEERDGERSGPLAESPYDAERVGVKQRRTTERGSPPSVGVATSGARKRKLDIMAPNLPSGTPSVTQPQYENNKVDSNNNNNIYRCECANVPRTDTVSPKRWRVNAILQAKHGERANGEGTQKHSNRHSIFMGNDVFDEDTYDVDEKEEVDTSMDAPRKPCRTFEVSEVNDGSSPSAPLRWRRRQDDNVSPEAKCCLSPVSPPPPPPCGWRSHWDENGGAPSSLSATYESYYRQQDDHRRSVASSLASLTLSASSNGSAAKRRSTASSSSSSAATDPVQRMDRELARIREAPVTVKNGASKFVVSLDMSIFRAEDIQLKLEPCRLTIEAIREAQIDESRSVIRSFVRKVGLPDDVATDVMATELSAYGVLTITLLKRRN